MTTKLVALRPATSMALLFFLVITFSACPSAEEEINPDFGFESYRYELWKNLVDGEHSIDLVGNFMDEGNYPAYRGQTFDRDHQGTGGIQTDGILEQLDEGIAGLDQVDIVLLGVGGNDLLDRGAAYLPQVITNLHAIIDQLQAANPQVTILIEQIAPGRADIMTTSVTSTFNDFNSQIPEIASSQSTDASAVVAVDMATDWQESYLADEVHYNVAGAKVVADRYYAAMTPYLASGAMRTLLPIGDSRVEGFRP
jgi:lysophospholipase L1-like esterase